MKPMLADAINFPFVLGAGLFVLVPLMAFEVFVEAGILKVVWRQPYRNLCGFCFGANLWSFLAGIPTKILNGFLYASLMPQDIPGYFSRYPFTAAMGTLIYFGVTLLVEGTCALRWNRREETSLTRKQIWRGILLANIATYSVLAPLEYFATRPIPLNQTLVTNTKWTSHPSTLVLFVDGTEHHLKSIQLNGSGAQTIVPLPMADYLVSSNLALCLFRGTNGNLYLWQHAEKSPRLIWETTERFLMNQTAFSPSGKYVAFASKEQNSIEVMTVATGKRGRLATTEKFKYAPPSVAWSVDENQFYVGGFDGGNRLVATIGEYTSFTSLTSRLRSETHDPPLLKCYGRTGDARWGGNADWGVSYREDTAGDLTVWGWPGLDSGLRIYRTGQKTNSLVSFVTVRSGLLHLAQFYFGDVAFLADGHECLFEAQGYLYLLGLDEKKLGTLGYGSRFILFTPRYEKAI